MALGKWRLVTLLNPEEVSVVNWFTKKKEGVSKSGEEIAKDIHTAILGKTLKPKGNDLKGIADIVWESLNENEDIKKFCADSRLPVCSLFHHSKNCVGIVVAMALDKGEEEGFSKEKIQLIRCAALLHDMGKLTALGKGIEHVKGTEKFLKELLGKIETLDTEQKHQIIRLATKHHSGAWYGDYQASLYDEHLLSRADSISSATDRRYELILDAEFGESDIKNRNSIKIKIVSEDKIFPHIIRFNDDPKEYSLGHFYAKESKISHVLGRKGELDLTVTPIEKLGHVHQLKFFHDDIVHGGIIRSITGYPSFKGELGLLAMDIQSIQRFIGEAKKLPALKGGSAIIRDAEEAAADVICEIVCPEAVLFKGGGNLISFVPTKEVIKNKIKKEIEDRIGEISQNGLKVAIVAENFPISRIMDDFGEVLSDLFEKVENKKFEPYLVEELKPDRSNEICGYCFHRSVAKDREGKIITDIDGTPVCKVCENKLSVGREEKRTSAMDRFITDLAGRLGLKVPHELEEIGDKIAMISIDGNMLARMFIQTSTPAEYSYKSESFDIEFRRILQNTIEEFVGSERNLKLIKRFVKEKGSYLGLIVLYIGGDDIFIIMNAKGALRFGKLLMKKVADRFTFESELYTTPIVTISMSIAIADYKFPVYFLLERAEELQSKAKIEFRDAVKTNSLDLFQLPQGSISFTTISSSMPSEEYYSFTFPSDEILFENLLASIDDVQVTEYRPLASLIINAEDDDESKLNLSKFLYSRLGAKDMFEKAIEATGKSKNALELCHETSEILFDKKMLGAMKSLIPMVWR